jgi:hypothetical protein
MMWACVVGAFCVAAVVNQGAIAVFRRAQAVTEPDPHQQSSPNSIFTSSGQPNCSLADDDSTHRKH